MMDQLRVQKFAIFDLSIGGFLSGVVGIILSIFTVLKLTPKVDQDDIEETQKNDNNMSTTVEPEHEDEMEDTLLGVYITFALFGGLLLLCSLALLLGTFKRQSKFVFPWLWAFGTTVLLILLLELLPELIDEFSFGYLFGIVLALGLSFYLLIVVYSLYKQLVDEELNRPPV